MQIRKRTCINKLFIPLLFLQVSTSEISYFTEFIVASCCIPTKITELLSERVSDFACFHHEKDLEKKMNVTFFLMRKKTVMEKLTFFSAYFCYQENLNFCGICFCKWKKLEILQNLFFQFNAFLELDFEILGQICKNKICKNCINLIDNWLCITMLLLYNILLLKSSFIKTGRQYIENLGKASDLA